jgi:hypothetical protein
MSAFFVSKRTIDNVVGHMRPALMTNDEAANSFGRELIELNICAMLDRYPHIANTDEHRAMTAARDDYTYTEHKDTTDAQYLKSLKCFTYQCCQSGIIEHPLLQKLVAAEEAFRRLLSREGTRVIPGYAEAQWDQD